MEIVHASAVLSAELDKALHAAARPVFALSLQRYFPHPVSALGVSNSAVAAIARAAIRAAPTATLDDWMAVARHFAATHTWHEHLILASALAAHCAPRVDDGVLLQELKAWLENDVGNWAQCDDLCIKPLHAYLKRHPQLLAELHDWGASPGAWCRRASNVGLVKFVGRSDHVDLVRVLANCERLLGDPDPYVQKGIGWMLKVASRHTQQAVLDFLVRHRGRIDRATLRYAIEKMPPEVRRSLL